MKTAPVWSMVQLQNGFPFDSPAFGDAGMTPLVRIRDLTAPSFETYLPFEVPDSQAVVTGDVVIGMDGEFNVIVWARERAALNQRLCRLRALDGASDVRFVAYALPAELRRIHETQFATTVKHLSSGEILSCRIPAPPADEQRRIADFLDDRVARIDRIIAARREQSRTALLALNAHWSEVTIGVEQNHGLAPLRRFLQSIVDGPFGSSLTSSHYADDGTRVIRLGNVGIGYFRSEDEAFISNEYATRLSSHSVQGGDLIMAGLGDETWPLGRCAVVPDDVAPAIVKADCYRIRLSSGIRHDYAAAFLSSPPARARTALMSRGATRARLNTDVARAAEISPIPVDAQQSYVQIVTEAQHVKDQASSVLMRSVDLLTEYKSSLITAAVTGELDVTTAGGGVPA